MQFKEDFLWGAATAANQYEGGYNEGGKGLSNSDVVTGGTKDTPRYITYITSDGEKVKKPIYETDHIPSDVTYTCFEDEYYPNHEAMDFYHHVDEDLQLLKELGVKIYRMSISWSRIYPNGDDAVPNEEGLKFYEHIIDTLVDYGITPMVTINHYEVPLACTEKFGAWMSRQMIDCYVTYCQTLFERYKGKVKYWVMFNEINHMNMIPFMAAGITTNDPQVVANASHYEFVASAKAVKLGKTIDPNYVFVGMMGHTQNYAYTCNPNDVYKRWKFMSNCYFYGDVQAKGYYPAYRLKQYENQGIVLDITDEDKEILKEGTVDCISISYYSSGTSATDKTLANVSPGNMTPKGPKNPYLPTNQWGWTIDPMGFRLALIEVYERYNKPVFIVENGLGYDDQLENDTVNDAYRIDYYKAHIQAIYDAMEEDGVEVLGYTPWSFIDIVSCGTGERKKRYGFVYVDKDDQGNGDYSRYKKASFYWYQQFIKNGYFE